MKNFFARLRQFRIFSKLPKKSELNLVFATFSTKEWGLFSVFMVLLLVGSLGLLYILNTSFMTEVPYRGGEIKEGIVGTPRFINPALAFSTADEDLATLVYSGLVRKDVTGNLTPDLAESYDVSPDGLTYTFVLKNNLAFHDGKPLTVDDIVFTINTIKDPTNKSPRRIDWEGVALEKVDERTIRFTLRRPFAPFLESTTLGILPAHIWNNSPIELNDANTNPVGSGPYKIAKISRQSSGVISHIKLARFEKFALGRPYIEDFHLYFYGSEEDAVRALKRGEVKQISSISPASARLLTDEGFRVESTVLPRVFGLFFNQSKNQIFLDKSVVRAIDEAVNKERIVREVLDGFGTLIDDPIPPNMLAYSNGESAARASREERMSNAEEILNKAGWKRGEDGYLEKTTTVSGKKTVQKLAFSISTGNAPELKRSAELISEDLDSIGIEVEVKTFELGNLNQSVIRPRDYDALLFGEIVKNESDLFAFWHSSQRKDPGLNVAIYTNAKVDKLLEDAPLTVDAKTRIEKYIQFQEEIKKDFPAVFLYSPHFIYVINENLAGLELGNLTAPANRFTLAHLWYTEVDNVWKVFASN